MWAISERQSAITEELVRRGADVHARSNNGFTALMFAAQLGDADSARLLLDRGANPNDIMPKTGLTPLIIAAAMSRTTVAAVLLDAGANPEAVDADGFTPLHHAARNKHGQVTPAVPRKTECPSPPEEAHIRRFRHCAARRHAALPWLQRSITSMLSRC
jgi:ankyrin repeat protein